MPEEELEHFLEITDKWSRRRFALRLDSSSQFSSLGDAIEYLNSLTQEAIQELISNGNLGQTSVLGLEDIRTALFEINNDGTLGSMYKQIKLKQKGKTLQPSDSLKFEHVTTEKEGYADIYVARLTLDRDNLPFSRNWEGFYKRRWGLNPQFKEFVDSIIKSKCGDKAEQILQPTTLEDKITFLKAVSEEIYNAPYEIYSRFIGKVLKFENGPDTLESIMEGRGGNCAEKAGALDFIAHNYGITGRIITAGDNANGVFPYDILRRALDEFDFDFKDAAQEYWCHNANYFEIDDTPVLIDATGGPVPLLFCQGEEAKEYLTQKKSNPVFFISREENYFYYDTPMDIAYDMLFTMEAFMSNIDITHVFGPEGDEAPFGFIVTKDFWICPTAYQTAEEYESNKKQWLEWRDEADHVKGLEVYPNLDASSEKQILAQIESKHPKLIADIRAADPGFLERCRQEWRDDTWNIGYVFTEFK